MSEILKAHFQLKETIVTISARDPLHIEAAKRSIREERALLEGFIQKDPYFLITLDPYDLAPDDAPRIAIEMIACTKPFGVGPMAAVAGSIAKYAVLAMIEAGATYAIVDNGGDISILNDEAVLVGIYAGCSSIKDLAFRINPRKNPLGIATSSGTVGPSISFGYCDAATVISLDSCLADAAATALGNAVQVSGDLGTCFDSIKQPGICGALVIRGEEMALWGKMPTLLHARVTADRITRE